MPTQTLFPNPYLAIDHKCRLAGITPELEPLRKGPVPPLNRKIGATIQMVDGSYRPDSKDGFFPGKGDVFYVYTSDPVEVHCEDGHVDEYRKMVERGEVLDASKELPLEALAMARLKAVADYVAHYGKQPDTTSWSVQFPLDADVAEVAEVMAKNREFSPAIQKAWKLISNEGKEPEWPTYFGIDGRTFWMKWCPEKVKIEIMGEGVWAELRGRHEHEITRGVFSKGEWVDNDMIRLVRSELEIV